MHKSCFSNSFFNYEKKKTMASLKTTEDSHYINICMHNYLIFHTNKGIWKLIY